MLFVKALWAKGDFQTLGADIQRELRENKKNYITRGILFIAVGIVAMLLSGTMPFKVEQMMGIILLAFGISRLFPIFGAKLHRWSLPFSFLLIVIGCVVLWHPQPVLQAFVAALAILMTCEGLLEIFLAFHYHPIHYWGWILFAGFVSLTFANIAWISIPFFDAISLSRLIAINLVLYGLLLLMLVWQTKY